MSLIVSGSSACQHYNRTHQSGKPLLHFGISSHFNLKQNGVAEILPTTFGLVSVPVHAVITGHVITSNVRIPFISVVSNTNTASLHESITYITRSLKVIPVTSGKPLGLYQEPSNPATSGHMLISFSAEN